MKETIKLIFAFTAIIFSFLYFFSPLWDRLDWKAEHYAEVRFWSWDIKTTPINTWITTTWGAVASWIVIDFSQSTGVQKTDEELYIQYKKSGTFVSFYPPKQGGISWGNYPTQTALLENYLSNNTFQFSLPNSDIEWYLYIRIKRPTESNLFAYWYNSDKDEGYTISWDLDKEKTLITWSTTEFLYKLDSIPYTKFFDKKPWIYNRARNLKAGNQNFIAWFIKDLDWSNQIEEMTIAWE